MMEDAVRRGGQVECGSEVDHAHRVAATAENSHKGWRPAGDRHTGLRWKNSRNVRKRDAVSLAPRLADEHGRRRYRGFNLCGLPRGQHPGPLFEDEARVLLGRVCTFEMDLSELAPQGFRHGQRLPRSRETGGR